MYREHRGTPAKLRKIPAKLQRPQQPAATSIRREVVGDDQQSSASRLARADAPVRHIGEFPVSLAFMEILLRSSNRAYAVQTELLRFDSLHTRSTAETIVSICGRVRL